MFSSVRMFARVTIRRAIAAKCYAAVLARAQMNPSVADFHTLCAFANFWLFDRLDRIEVRAGAISHLRLPLFEAASRR
jgi:hypothetical protein